MCAKRAWFCFLQDSGAAVTVHWRQYNISLDELVKLVIEIRQRRKIDSARFGQQSLHPRCSKHTEVIVRSIRFGVDADLCVIEMQGDERSTVSGKVIVRNHLKDGYIECRTLVHYSKRIRCGRQLRIGEVTYVETSAIGNIRNWANTDLSVIAQSDVQVTQSLVRRFVQP